MRIGKYKLEYMPKVERAIQNVGNDEQNILVEYDKLGGLITMDGERVKRGSFYNVKEGKAHAKPQVVVMRKPRPAEEVSITEEVVVDEKPKKATKKTTKKASK